MSGGYRNDAMLPGPQVVSPASPVRGSPSSPTAPSKFLSGGGDGGLGTAADGSSGGVGGWFSDNPHTPLSARWLLAILMSLAQSAAITSVQQRAFEHVQRLLSRFLASRRYLGEKLANTRNIVLLGHPSLSTVWR